MTTSVRISQLPPIGDNSALISVTTIEEFHWRAWIFIPLAGILAGIFQIFRPSADHLTGLIVSRFGFFNNYLVHCPGLSNYITMNNCVVAFVFLIFHPF